MNFFFPNGSSDEKSGQKMTRVRSKFSKQEDSLLVSVVNELGTRDWEAIASRIPNRNARQCRERYTNYLAPNLSHEPWTPEEDSLLEQKLKELGAKWVNISKYFKNRTDTMLKNRWLVLSRRSPHLAKQTPNLQNISAMNHKKKIDYKPMPLPPIKRNLPEYQPQMMMPQYQAPQQLPPQIPQQQAPAMPPPPPIPSTPKTTDNNSNPQKKTLPPLLNLLCLDKIIQKAPSIAEIFDIDQFTKNMTKKLF